MTRDQVEKVFALFAAKDLEKVMAALPTMRWCSTRITRCRDERQSGDPSGFEWGLGNMEKPAFAIRNFGRARIMPLLKLTRITF